VATAELTVPAFDEPRRAALAGGALRIGAVVPILVDDGLHDRGPPPTLSPPPSMRTASTAPAAFPTRTAAVAAPADYQDTRSVIVDEELEGELAAANARWIAWLHNGGTLIDLREEPPPV